MYSIIIDPNTGGKITTNSVAGMNILRNYVKAMYGGAKAESDSSPVILRDRVELDVSFTPPKYNQGKRGVTESDCAYFSVGIAAQYVMQKNFDDEEEALMEKYLALCPILDPADEGTLIKIVRAPFRKIFANTIYKNVRFEDNMRGMKLACSEMIRYVIDKREIAVIDIINMGWDTHTDRFVQGSAPGHNVCVVGYELYGDGPDGYFIIQDSYPDPHRRTLQFSLIDKAYLDMNDAVYMGDEDRSQEISDSMCAVRELFAVYKKGAKRQPPKRYGRRNPQPHDSAVATVENAVEPSRQRRSTRGGAYGVRAVHGTRHYGLTHTPQYPVLSCSCYEQNH